MRFSLFYQSLFKFSSRFLLRREFRGPTNSDFFLLSCSDSLKNFKTTLLVIPGSQECYFYLMIKSKKKKKELVLDD